METLAAVAHLLQGVSRDADTSRELSEEVHNVQPPKPGSLVSLSLRDCLVRGGADATLIVVLSLLASSQRDPFPTC